MTLVNILNEFQNARALPNGFDHDILNADTLKEQSVSWHKACRVQFNNTKLERARKRRDRGMKSDDGPSVVKHTRSSLGSKEVPSSSTTNVSPHGEDKCFVILGGLHIEMATLRALVIWLQDSGWVPALVQAEIATPGTAESFIKVAHVTKTRHVHQITAASLSILKHKAYQAYLTNLQSDEPGLAFDVWQQKRIAESPLFQYWSLTLKLQLILLMFLRAQRDGNFVLYVESLDKLAPWFFAFDQINYARWLPVNILDLNMLAHVHPGLHQEFQAGNFVIHKTPNVSSGMSIDQAHEQNNDMVKGSGGAVGLTESPSAFTRWMVAGPELSRTLT